MREWLSGGAPPCQGGGRGFDPRLALLKTLDLSRVFLFHVAFHVASRFFLLYVPFVNGKLNIKLDASILYNSDNGTFPALVKNNEVWLIIFNRISTSDSCVCVVSRYADTVSFYIVSKSETMSVECNNQGTVAVKYNGSTYAVYGGAFKIFG